MITGLQTVIMILSKRTEVDVIHVGIRSLGDLNKRCII